MGGAAGEAGSGFRAGAAAYVAAHLLRGQPFTDLDLLPESAVPLSFHLESDDAVDDVAIQLSGGAAFLQAKRHLDFGQAADSSLIDTVRQWISLDRERGIDPVRDRLVAAAATASGPVHALGRALRRRRRRLGGSYATDERAALRRLERLLSDVSDGARERILRSAVIWVADLEETNDLSARLGQALLEPGVVAVDQGMTAWRTLREQARDLARRRYGAQLDDLMEALREVPLELTADSEGYAAARRQERELKLQSYRHRVLQRGEALDLRGLGAALPPIPLAEMDARIEVYAPAAADNAENDDRSNNGGLGWALRRRGRALLLGLPGSGKSVALRAAAAHYAARTSWPLPIVVPLDRVARLIDVRGFGEALLEVAFQQEPVEDQAALRAAAVDALRGGHAALFLDALDETRTFRQDVVAGIEQELSTIDPAVEVLVSTRDVAYADAHTLGLADLRLIAPDRPNDTARAVLRASAEQRQLPPNESQEWLRARREWVRERLRGDPALGETPLMVVLLALVAAEHRPDALPSGRAALLERVVSDVVVRWEAGRRLHGQHAQIGSLRGADAIRSAQLAFRVIGHLIFLHGDPYEAVVLNAVGEGVTAEFGLAPGLAAGVAEDAIVLWDEAGVFMRSSEPRRLSARIRLFAELAEALYARSLGQAAQQHWLDQLLTEEQREPILLAAGLHGGVADALGRRAVETPGDATRLDVVAAAIRQGAALSRDVQADLVDAVLAAETTTEEQRWDRALALVQFRVEPQQQRRVLDFFGALDEPSRTVARALSVDGWRRDDQEVEDDLVAVLRLDPDRVRRPGSGFFEALGPDPDYQEAVLSAGRRLLRPGQRDVAELVNERVHTGLTAAASQHLRRRLVETGFRSLVERAERELAQDRRRPNYEAVFEESDRASDRLLEMIAGLDAPCELTAIQRRRLDDLVSLVRTSGFGAAHAGDATYGVLRDSQRLAAVLRAAAVLGRLAPPVLAAEAAELRAAILIEKQDRFGPLFMLSDGGSRLDLTAWERVSNPEATATELANAVASPYQWIGWFAARCLAAAPAGPRDVAVARLDEELPIHRAHVAFLVALAALILARDAKRLGGFTADERPMVRRAAARYWGGYGTPDDQAAAMRALLADDDGGVRQEAVRSVRRLGLADSLRADLERAAEQAGWQCFWCGANNGAGEASCTNCRLNGPDVANAVQQGLAG